MTTDFYNKVARKFGNYQTGAKYIREYQDDDPEEVFKKKLLELGGKNKIALDIGCADGYFTLTIAPHFQRIIAIDLSTQMLGVAKELQKERGIGNVNFEEQNASKTTYADSSFDVVYSRRGPTYFTEFQRLLKSGGYFIQIGIGEKDCQEIKEIFGRGQGYKKWNISRLEENGRELEEARFKIIFSQDYFYNEYYASYGDLDLFLQGVPIFEDFDSEKDRKFLRGYVAKFETKKGIRFPRHRIVIVAKRI